MITKEEAALIREGAIPAGWKDIGPEHPEEGFSANFGLYSVEYNELPGANPRHETTEGLYNGKPAIAWIRRTHHSSVMAGFWVKK